jgi:hypothetical protein
MHLPLQETVVRFPGEQGKAKGVSNWGMEHSDAHKAEKNKNQDEPLKSNSLRHYIHRRFPLLILHLFTSNFLAY